MADGIRSIHRCFEILRCFDTHRKPLSAKNIADSIEAPLSSTIDLLRSICGTGFMAYDGSNRTYVPTIELARLGEWQFEQKAFHTRLEPLLYDLGEKTEETVTTYSLNGFSMQCVMALPGMQPINLNIQPGDRVPLFRSATGLACLSIWGEEKLSALLLAAMKAAELKDQAAADAVVDTLKVTAKKGYASAFDTAIEGVGAVAAPLPHAAFSNLAVSVGGPTQRIREAEDEIGKALLATVEEARTLA